MLSTGISRITGSSGFSACFLPLSQNPPRSSQLVFMSAFPFPAGFCFLLQHTTSFARNLPFFSLWPPCGGAVLWRPPKVGQVCKVFLPSHSIILTDGHSCNTQKATAVPSLSIRAAKRHTKTILSSLFPIHCAKQPLSGTQENQGDFTISPSLKGGGAFVGGTFGSLPHLSAAESRPQASGLQSKPPATLSQRLKVAVWRSSPHAGDTSPGWAVPCGSPPQSGPAVRAV